MVLTAVERRPKQRQNHRGGDKSGGEVSRGSHTELWLWGMRSGQQ